MLLTRTNAKRPVASSRIARTASRAIASQTARRPCVRGGAAASELEVDKCIRLIGSEKGHDHYRRGCKREFPGQRGGLKYVFIAGSLEPQVEQKQREREHDQQLRRGPVRPVPLPGPQSRDHFKRPAKCFRPKENPCEAYDVERGDAPRPEAAPAAGHRGTLRLVRDAEHALS